MKSLSIIILLLSSISIYSQSKFFDPDGYYSPKEKFSIAKLNINFFEIRTLSYYNNNKLDYDHPKFNDPEVSVCLIGVKKWLRATNIIVNKDTLSFQVPLSKDKFLQYAGNFLDKRGQYWNQNDVVSQETIIVSGEFSLVEKGQVKEKKNCRLTYWEGD